jgi:hypothetical protein
MTILQFSNHAALLSIAICDNGLAGFEILIVLSVKGNPGFDDIVKRVHETEQQFADLAHRVAT